MEPIASTVSRQLFDWYENGIHSQFEAIDNAETESDAHNALYNIMTLAQSMQNRHVTFFTHNDDRYNYQKKQNIGPKQSLIVDFFDLGTVRSSIHWKDHLPEFIQTSDKGSSSAIDSKKGTYTNALHIKENNKPAFLAMYAIALRIVAEQSNEEEKSRIIIQLINLSQAGSESAMHELNILLCNIDDIVETDKNSSLASTLFRLGIHFKIHNDLEKARHYFQKAAQKGCAKSKIMYALYLLKDGYTIPDTKLAINQLLESASKQMHPFAFLILGDLAHKENQYEMALKNYLKALYLGNEHAHHAILALCDQSPIIFDNASSALEDIINQDRCAETFVDIFGDYQEISRHDFLLYETAGYLSLNAFKTNPSDTDLLQKSWENFNHLPLRKRILAFGHFFLSIVEAAIQLGNYSTNGSTLLSTANKQTFYSDRQIFFLFPAYGKDQTIDGKYVSNVSPSSSFNELTTEEGTLPKILKKAGSILETNVLQYSLLIGPKHLHNIKTSPEAIVLEIKQAIALIESIDQKKSNLDSCSLENIELEW